MTFEQDAATVNRSVLVVDDEQDIAINLSDILKDLGFEVDLAFDGATALEMVQAKSYTFALLDFQMPGMNGVELTNHLKRLQPCMIVLMVTAYTGNEQVKRVMEQGAWTVLSKPVEVPELLGQLSESVRQPLVLLVDDDKDFTDSAWEILKEAGIRVCVASNESEATRRLGELRFDVVLLDLQLGNGESGERVFDQARKINERAKVFVVTGYADSKRDIVNRLIEQGVEGVIPKPLEIAEVIDVIRRHSNLTRDTSGEAMP